MRITRGKLYKALREQAAGGGTGGTGGGAGASSGGSMGGGGGMGNGGGMSSGGTSGKAISAPSLSLGFGTDPRWFKDRKRCKHGRKADGTCRK